jgi:hypothetical protein|tara:strand:+ start:570 stop:770 length:201 start_codon:yes stop_codon:yes gene_type:complete
VNSIDETIEDFDDDEATDFYFTALIVIAEEFNISLNDAHLGIEQMKEEMDDLVVDRTDKHEKHTKH